MDREIIWLFSDETEASLIADKFGLNTIRIDNGRDAINLTIHAARKLLPQISEIIKKVDEVGVYAKP